MGAVCWRGLPNASDTNCSRALLETNRMGQRWVCLVAICLGLSSQVVARAMEEIREQIVDFPGEWADLLVALNQLKLATDKATKVREEYIRRAEAATKEKERG